MKDAKDATREAGEAAKETVWNGYVSALKKVGVDHNLLAQRAKEALNADLIKHQKLKGWFDRRRKLPPGYKVIKGTTDETLIEYRGPDYKTRESAREDLQKVLDLYPNAKIKLEHGGSVDLITWEQFTEEDKLILNDVRKFIANKYRAKHKPRNT